MELDEKIVNLNNIKDFQFNRYFSVFISRFVFSLVVYQPQSHCFMSFTSAALIERCDENIRSPLDIQKKNRPLGSRLVVYRMDFSG